MKNVYGGVVLGAALGLIASSGCATTSNEDTRAAKMHQREADEAAKSGMYQRAAEEQKAADESHASAVKKAQKEGQPVPAQPQPSGQANPPSPPR